MNSTVMLARGQIWWASVPYKDDPTNGKVRMVVVVGWSSFQKGDDETILVVPITTFDGDPSGKVRNGDVEITDTTDTLVKPGAYLRCRRLMTLAPQAFLFDRGSQGLLPNAHFQTVLTEVEKLFAVGQYVVVPS